MQLTAQNKMKKTNKLTERTKIVQLSGMKVNPQLCFTSLPTFVFLLQIKLKHFLFSPIELKRIRPAASLENLQP